MDFRICNDIDECEALWNAFSPNERLFDVWDYRACFFDEDEHEPYFIAGYADNKIEGLIPLVFVKSKRQYNYFGGWFTAERNSLYLKDKAKVGQFLEQCPVNTYMEGLDPREGKYYNFLNDDYTHSLNVSKYNHDFDKYFSSLNKKRQKNLARDFKTIPKYKIHSNRVRDFERLAELNIKRYEHDSRFHDAAIKNGVLRLINLASQQGILDMISLEINGRVEAVDVCAFFRGRYYALIGSSNYQRISNLGKLMTKLDIQNAMEKKAESAEFGATADHWKNMWEFDKEMLLKFVK